MSDSKTPHPLQIDGELVRSLISDQFPNWANLPITPVPHQGHDNRTFRLGDDLSVRLPSRQQYAAHVETEFIWLPRLAPHLPLPIPTPLAMGAPSAAYPFPWTINRWLDGETVSAGRIDDPARFGIDLADFLNALHSIDTKDAPGPGPDNFHRGGDLAVYDDDTRTYIDTLSDLVDTRTAARIWESALEAQWTGSSLWLHGDMAVGNLLVDRGKLSAVIDFGQLAAGDPSCDITIAWTFLSVRGRQAFRDTLATDDATWARGRGWAIWKALFLLHESPSPESDQLRIIHDIILD